MSHYCGIDLHSNNHVVVVIDGLQEHGYDLQLVNTATVKQYDGLKYSGDRHDAFHLAHLMRLGILPTGYIYPKE